MQSDPRLPLITSSHQGLGLGLEGSSGEIQSRTCPVLVQCLGEGAEGLPLITFSDPDFLPKEPPLSGQHWLQSATPSSASTSPCSASGVPGIRNKMPASLLHFSPEEIWTLMLSLEADQPHALHGFSPDPSPCTPLNPPPPVCYL